MMDDAQDRPSVSKCQQCKGEMWHGEPLFCWDGKWVCLECFKDHVKAMLDRDPSLLALEMGVDVERIT